MIKTIKIAGVTYPIQYTNKIDIKNAMAYIDFGKQVIKISTNYPIETQKAALLHEVIHGVSYAFNVGLSEDEVDKLSRGLYATLKDNPDYIIMED